MFKKLDKLLIKAFIGPFIVTFFITLLVLLLQFFWLYIDDFVGKGLDISIILKFVWYQAASLVPLALPLALLLSSLMTFGNLGESFELVAIKTAGISLLRFMRPIFIISLFISGIAFLFSNYVIPVAFLKSKTMLWDITYAKPAFDLKEGVFYDGLNGFAIKIGKKESNDSIMRDVIIYEETQNLQDNFIIAESAVMRTTEDKRFLEFNLKDGWRYQERGNSAYDGNTEYIRLAFKEYKKQFDLSSFQFSQTPDSLNKNNEKVYSMRQLNVAIDSIKKDNRMLSNQLQNGMYGSLKFSAFVDSGKTALVKAIPDSQTSSSVVATKDTALKGFDRFIPDSVRDQVNRTALNYISSLQSSFTSMLQTLKDRERILRKHEIEWHRKIVLSLSCLIFFLIGAPLGSIIRKGGLGTPLIAAIAFFMVFYFSAATGERFAKEGSTTPVIGMWMPVFILLPVSIFLIFKALKDSQLFNKEWYYRMAKPFREKFLKKKPQPGL